MIATEIKEEGSIIGHKPELHFLVGLGPRPEPVQPRYLAQCCGNQGFQSTYASQWSVIGHAIDFMSPTS